MRRIALAALAAALAAPAPAQAWTLGIGDRGDAPADVGRQLGARTYRVVIDPDRPLASYDGRIFAHRAAGQEPQLIIGGTGTRRHANRSGLVAVAAAAQRRWPFAYSIGVLNEPNLAGVSVCQYVTTWRQAYRSLRAIGARRVTFGEWAPQNALGWHRAALTRCGKDSRQLRRIRLAVAWHAYTLGPGMDTYGYGRDLRRMHRQLEARSPMLLITEAGYPPDDRGGLRYWHGLLRAVRRDHVAEVVAWDIHSPDAWSKWNSALIEPDGRVRPAFHVIARAARH